jgi:hypothetical protein
VLNRDHKLEITLISRAAPSTGRKRWGFRITGADNLLDHPGFGYNARMFVALVCSCFLLNSGGAVYLLARANFERWKKTLFAVLALASLALELILARAGHNYDLDSFGIVASLVLHGKSFYANTVRFNYGPVWAFILAGLKQLSTLLPSLGGEAFHVAVAAFLWVTDVAMAAMLAAKYRYGAGIFFLCCPATILLTGYHSQFENFALLAGLASWLLIRSGSTPLRRLVFAAGLQGLSLSIKHILFLFPVWILFWPQLGSWRKRMAYVVVAYGIFGLSFLPWMLDPHSRAGVFHHVFQYRSSFTYSLPWLIVSAHPYAPISTVESAILTGGWMAVLIAVGMIVARGNGDLFPMYLLAMFAFSPAMADHYLTIPVLASAILCMSWPSWAVAGTATLAAGTVTLEMLTPLGGTLRYTRAIFITMPSTQLCAAALLLVQLWCASPAQTAPLAPQQATRKAVILAFGSLAIVLAMLLAKSLALHWAIPRRRW